MEQTPTGVAADVHLLDESERVVVEVQRFRARVLDAAPAGPEPVENTLYAVAWEPAETADSASEGTQDQADAPGAGRNAPASWLILADRAGTGRPWPPSWKSRARGLLVFAGSEPRPPLAKAPRARSTFITARRRWVDPADPWPTPACWPTWPAPGAPLPGVVHLWALDTPPRPERRTALLGPSDWAAGPPCTWCRPWLVGWGNRGGWESSRRARVGSAAPAVAGHPRRLVCHRYAGPDGADGATARTAQTAPAWPRHPCGASGGWWPRSTTSCGGPGGPRSGVTPGEAGRLFDLLWSPRGEDQVAFRAGRRLVARLVRHQEFDPPARPSRLRSFRAGASYLITGGLGGLGLEVARWMVRQGARRLILLGRSPLPARPEWASLDAESRPGGPSRRPGAGGPGSRRAGGGRRRGRRQRAVLH